MAENEILARGIVAGVAIVLPFLGFTVGRWHSWKGRCKFWQMMHKDLSKQNERLFQAVKLAEDKAAYFESRTEAYYRDVQTIVGFRQMSELNVYHHELRHNEYEEFYLKYEADKVIAELEMKLAAAKLVLRLNEPKALYSNLDTMSRLNHKIDVVERRELHQKYKRCLAMAGWCEATALWCYQAANTLPTGFHATLFGKPVMIETHRLYNRFELLTKWSNRWMNLAKKFKPNKE